MVDHSEQKEKVPLYVLTEEDQELPMFMDPIIFGDHEERIESLAVVFIQLLDALNEGRTGNVSRELTRLIEFVFRHSETYDLALRLYEKRFLLKGSNPKDLLEMLLKSQPGDEAGPADQAESESQPEKEKKPLPPLSQKQADLNRIILFCDDEEVLDRMLEAAGRQGREALESDQGQGQHER